MDFGAVMALATTCLTKRQPSSFRKVCITQATKKRGFYLVFELFVTDK